MARRNECDHCGLAACDLPDDIDADYIFDTNEHGATLCQGCEADFDPLADPADAWDRDYDAYTDASLNLL